MSNRIEKLNSSFKRDIAELLTKKVKDPRITEMFTVLEVDCDKELSTAKVYISVFSADEQKAAQTFGNLRKRTLHPQGNFPQDAHTQSAGIPFPAGYVHGVWSENRGNTQ